MNNPDEARCTYCDVSLWERIIVKSADGDICSDCADEFAAGLSDGRPVEVDPELWMEAMG